MDLIYSLAAASMCDHKWILLTSRELEQHLGYIGVSAWSVRGCERCLEVYINKNYGRGWNPLEQFDAPLIHLVPFGISYWNGIALFRGGRNV